MYVNEGSHNWNATMPCQLQFCCHGTFLLVLPTRYILLHHYLYVIKVVEHVANLTGVARDSHCHATLRKRTGHHWIGVPSNILNSQTSDRISSIRARMPCTLVLAGMPVLFIRVLTVPGCSTSVLTPYHVDARCLVHNLIGHNKYRGVYQRCQLAIQKAVDHVHRCF